MMSPRLLPHPLQASRHMRHCQHRQHGGALLAAMVIVTMVTTLAASMIWMQWRSVQVESAERDLIQSQWVLRGFLDYGRIFLREDARNGGPDHLGEQWAVPLAEVPIASFLSADRNNTEDAPEGFLAGQILDATARYNLFNLLNFTDDPVDIVPAQLTAFKRLCEYAGVPPSAAEAIAQNLRKAMMAYKYDTLDQQQLGGEAGRRKAPLAPQTLDQMVWLGVDAGTIERLRPFVTVYPAKQGDESINVNTASREVLAAMVPGLDLGRADRIVQARQRNPFKDDPADEIEAAVGKVNLTDSKLVTTSKYFELQGRMRLSNRVLVQSYIVERGSDGNVVTLVENTVFGVESPDAVSKEP